MSDEKNVGDLIKEGIDEALKPIKEKLNIAYGKVDALEAENKALKDDAQAAKVALLEEQGKKEEALRLQLEQSAAQLAALASQNTELSRDAEIRLHLSSVTFKSPSAATMAFKLIAEGLSKNDKGEWVSRDGKDIGAYTKEVISHADNAFLIKVKASAGYVDPEETGTPPPQKKSLKDMTQAELLAGLQDGTIKR